MSKSKKPLFLYWLIPLILAFIYFYPRFLISQFGEASPWTSYFYMYGFGYVFFFVGIYLILKSGSCNLTRQRDRFWFKATLAGLVYFSSMHAIWIWLALSIPVKGAL